VELAGVLLLRRYCALVTGRLERLEGTVDALVHGKPSLTRFAVLGHRWVENVAAWVTLVDLWPVTGRQHQLRHHMTHLGHPIVGEAWHAEGKNVPDGALFPGWQSKGLFLWAVGLAFEHPITGEDMQFSVEVPNKFSGPVGRRKKSKQCQDMLRNDHNGSVSNGSTNGATPRDVPEHTEANVCVESRHVSCPLYAL
jgi:hypothetical protein